MKLPHILIIDDQYARDETERHLFLRRAGLSEVGPDGERNSEGEVAQVTICSGQVYDGQLVRNDYAVIREAIEQDDWSLILLDARFDSGLQDDRGLPAGSPGDDEFGESVRKRLHVDFPGLPVVMLTGKRQEELAEDSAPYLSKQGFDARRMREALLAHGRLSTEQIRSLLGLDVDTVVEAAPALAVFRQVFVHAPRNISILILGESGVGKEVLARFVHQQSLRSGSFVGVNIAALSRDLLESELFGVEKGAATGVGERPGKFEMAAGGTLFLDEIGDMPLEAQAKVLRALQEREVFRVGGSKPVTFDVRLVCATSRDLGELIADGQFRGDLYYRINTVMVSIPPLRDRPADIVPLARAFVDKFSTEFQLTGITLSAEALELLRAQSFRGNVRELENLVRRLISGSGNNRLVSATDVQEALGVQPTRVDKAQLQTLRGTLSPERPVKAPLDGDLASPPLSDLTSILESLAVRKDDPALSGLLPKFDEAVSIFRRRLAGAVLERCRDPVTGQHNRQRAMQLLSGDRSLKGKGPPRLINEILRRKQENEVSDGDLEELVAVWRATLKS